MAALSNNDLTLADWAQRIDPQGKTPVVAELLSQTNEVLDDAVFIVGNLPTGHRSMIRIGLPEVYWRKLNSGVPTSKSTTVAVTETVGMLEAYSRTDKDIAELGENVNGFRLSEDKAFLEAMNQAQARALFYGDPGVDPNQYLGLSHRYSSSTAGNAQNIIDGGSDTEGVNTSIYVVVWGENSIHCIFPKGSKAGLSHRDLNEQVVYDENGNPYQAYLTHYQWKSGLVVKDWRYAVRICNINTNLLLTNGTGHADIIKLLSRSLDRIPNFNMGRAAIYMNRTIHSMLRLQALEKVTPGGLGIEKGLNQFGTPQAWTTFGGIPLRRVDQISNTESLVAF
ncbi:conserved hypothetical protein [Gammaproteobacteria bacterium]